MKKNFEILKNAKNKVSKFLKLLKLFFVQQIFLLFVKGLLFLTLEFFLLNARKPYFPI